MATSLSQIRVEASLDASGYIAEAERKVAADAKMADSSIKVGQATEQTDRRLGTSVTGFERLARALDPAYAAQQRLTVQTAALNRALESGGISQQRYNELLGAAEAKAATAIRSTAGMTEAVNTNTRAFGLNRQGVQELQASGVNAFQALAAGMTPWRVAQTEGAQVLGAFIQGGRLGFATIATWAAPLAVVTAAIGAFVVGVVRLANTQENIRQLALDLNALGTSGEASGAQMQAAFQRIRDSGTSATDALTAVQTVARNPLINPARATEVVELARDISAVTGETLPQAQQALTAALTGGTDAIIKYGFSLNALTADQAAAIRRSGDLGIAVTALEQHFSGKFQESMTATGRASESIANAWNRLLDTWMNTAPITAVRDAVLDVLHALEKMPDTAAAAWKWTKEQITGPQPVQVPIPPLAGGALPQVAGASAAEQTALSEIARRESNMGKQLENAASSASGWFQILDGTWKDWAQWSKTDIGEFKRAKDAPFDIQAQVALWGLRQFGPNSTNSWAASGTARGNPYSTAGLAPPMIAQGMTTQQQTDAINKQQDAFDKANTAAGQFGATQRALTTYEEVYTKALADGMSQESAKTKAQDAARQAFQAASIEMQKQTTLADRLAKGTLDVSDAFITSTAAGLRQAATLQASTEVFDRYGTTVGHTADITQRANEILAQQAAEAAKSLEQQAALAREQAVNNDALVQASTRGAAALRDAQIVAQAAAETQGAYNFAIATGNDALKARIEAQRAQTIEQLKSNEAVRETVQANLQADQVRQTNELLQLQLNIVGQTSEAQQAALITARAKQDIERRLAEASPAAKQAILDQVSAEADLVIRLGEARAAAQRFDEEIRSIAETIASTIGTAIDDIFSGKKVDDWGKRLQDMLRQIGNTIVQSEIVKPLLGSLLGGLSPSLAQQFGTIGGGGGVTGIGDLLGGAGKLVGLGGGGGGGGGIFGAGGLFGSQGSLFGTAADVSIAGGGAPLSLGSTLSGAEGLAGGGGLLSGLGGIGSMLSSAIPFIGPLIGIGSLLGSLFKGPAPTNATGGTINLGAPGGTINLQTSGSSVNAAAAGQLLNPINQFSASLFQQTGGSIPGVVAGQAFTNKQGQQVFQLDYAGPSGAVKAQFGSAQEAINAAELAIAHNLQGVGDAMKKALSSVTDPAQIQDAIAFVNVYTKVNTAFDDVFASFEGASRQAGAYGQALDKINANYQSLVISANKYTLDVSPIRDSWMSAMNRLRDDFNDNIQKMITAINDPFQKAIRDEQEAGAQRVADALKVGGDLAQVTQLDAANLEKVALAAAGSLGTISHSITDLVGQFADSLQSMWDTVETQITRVQTSQTGQTQLTGQDPFTQAFNKIQENAAAVAASNAASFPTTSAGYQKQIDDAQRTADQLLRSSQDFTKATGIVNTALQSQAEAAQRYADNLGNSTETLAGLGQQIQSTFDQINVLVMQRLAADFNANMANLMTGITNPLQAAVNAEYIAGQNRVTIAKQIGADLAQVEAYNQANMTRVVKSTMTAANDIGLALEAALGKAGSLATTGDLGTIGTLGQAIASAVGTFGQNSGAFTQALSALNDAFGTAVQQIHDLTQPGNAPDFSALLQGYAGSIDKLRGSFSAMIQAALTGLNDPVQAAIDIELQNAKMRLNDAVAIGADLAQVEQYNDLNLRKVAETAAQSAASAITMVADAIAAAAGKIGSLTTTGTLGTVGTLGAAIQSVITGGIGPFTQALAGLNQALFTALDNVKSLGGGQNDFGALLQSYATNLDKLRSSFAQGIASATEGILDPVQAAIDAELKAAQQRLDDAVSIGADLQQVEQYNTLNLRKVAESAARAINTVADAIEAAAGKIGSLSTTGTLGTTGTFGAAIAGTAQSGIGPFTQALGNLNQALFTALDNVKSLGGTMDDFNQVLTAYGNNLDKLRTAFDESISTLMVGLTDPVQAAIDAEKKSGAQRVADAIAVGGDLNAVTAYNAENMKRVGQAALEAANNLQGLVTQFQAFNQTIQSLKQGQLSGKTPAQQVTASGTNFDQILSAVMAGDYSQLSALGTAGTTWVQASQAAYGNSAQTAQIRTKVMNALQSIADSTDLQAEVAAQGKTSALSTLSQLQQAYRDQVGTAHRQLDQLRQTEAAYENQYRQVNPLLVSQINSAQVTVAEMDQQANTSGAITQATVDHARVVNGQLAQQVDTGQQIVAAGVAAAAAGGQAAAAQGAAAGASQVVAANAQQTAPYARWLYEQWVYHANQNAGNVNQQVDAGNAQLTSMNQAAAASLQVANAQADSAQSSAATAGHTRNSAAWAQYLFTLWQANGQATGTNVSAQLTAGQSVLNSLNQTAGAAQDTAGSTASGADLAKTRLAADRQANIAQGSALQTQISAMIGIAQTMVNAQQALQDNFNNAIAAFSKAIADFTATITGIATAPATSTPIAAAPTVPPGWHTYKIDFRPGETFHVLTNNELALQWAGLGAAVYGAGSSPYPNLSYFDITPRVSGSTTIPGTPEQAAQWASTGAAVTPYQHGSSFTSPGWAMVGEAGPELMWTPGGSRVLPTGQTPGGSDDVIAELRGLREMMGALLRVASSGHGETITGTRAVAAAVGALHKEISFSGQMPRRVA